MKSCKPHEKQTKKHQNARSIDKKLKTKSLMFFVSFFSCHLQDFKFWYVNLKAFGASFLYWVDFTVNQKAAKTLNQVLWWTATNSRRKSFSQPMGHVTRLIPCRDSRKPPSNSKISLNALISTFLVLIYILGQFCCIVTYGLWCFNVTCWLHISCLFTNQNQK